jgi:hypothetical protein
MSVLGGGGGEDSCDTQKRAQQVFFSHPADEVRPNSKAIGWTGLLKSSAASIPAQKTDPHLHACFAWLPYFNIRRRILISLGTSS